MLNRNIQPRASIEDLVSVVGYGNRVFRVEEHSVIFRTTKDVEEHEIAYDLACPFTFEYVYAEESDVTIVCKAPQADAYLTQIEPHSTVAPPTDYVDLSAINLEVLMKTDVAPKPKRKTQRQKQAEIDGLLDELITMQTVIDICGSDDEFAVRIADVKRKLTEATA